MRDSVSMKCPEQAHPQTQEADQWLPGAGGSGRGDMEGLLTVWVLGDDENFLKLIVVRIAQPCECAKNHRIVHFKGVTVHSM